MFSRMTMNIRSNHMATDTIPVRTNGHDSHPDTGIAECPLCGSNITNQKAIEITNRQRQRESEIIAAIEAKSVREIAKIEAGKKAEIVKATKAAVQVAETKMTALRESQEATIAARVAAEREKTAKQVAKAVSAEKLQHTAEKLRLETQLADMQRRLQAKTAHQIGEPAEVDLFETLCMAFPTDRVSRVVKGVRGPDVLVEVLLDGDRVAGKIALDSKAHARWSNRFTSKLRADQLAEGADFAILSTTVFPSGAGQLYEQDKVLVAAPARVPVLVSLLRQIIIDNFVQRLGQDERNSKADRLYDFVLSKTCDDLFGGLLRLTNDLAALDQTEQKAHHATWEKRAALIEAVAAIREQFVRTVANIVSGDAS
jgi:hypothetical protein